MKYQYIAMNISKAPVLDVVVNNIPTEVEMGLPDGCTGILYVFKTKKAARAWWGKDIDLIPVEEGRKEE